MSTLDASLERVSLALAGARRVAVLTGAGMSAASGLPTYRGIGGLYNDMAIEEGLPIEEILHADTFAR
ncbi:MAG: Sir2 family NAD-dependent protein deacetylase, partial [Gammaproteobacteria bacterium]